MSFFKKHQVTIPNCIKCGLYKNCHSPKMKVRGEGKKGILIILPAMEEYADRQGLPLQKDYLSKLSSYLHKFDISLSKDCWYVPAAKCNDGSGTSDTKTKKNIAHCRKSIVADIKDKNPSKIILIGNDALTSFYGGRNNQFTSVENISRLKIYDSKYKAWVFPTPSIVNVSQRSFDKLLESEFKRCLKQAFEADPKPLVKEWAKCHSLLNFKKAYKALTECLKNDTTIAIDYEATGLSAYLTEHKTVSFAWCNGQGAWAVLVEHPYWTKKQQKKIKKAINKILSSDRIRKIVHNITYEYPWTKERMGCVPANFFWDTQLSSHVLYNKAPTNLKFQAFYRWGIENYDADASKYIKSVNGTPFNRMLKMPIDKILEYNAKDVLYTFELYKEHKKDFAKGEYKAFKFLQKGAVALCDMSGNGITVDKEHFAHQREKLAKERTRLVKDIYKLKDVKTFEKTKGKFDFNSPKELRIMLFDIMGIEVKKKTKTGASVDEEVLSKISVPLTKYILRIRKIDKIISTYIDGVMKYTVDDKVHATFSLTRARSFRSSSSNPNAQNWPKRDPNTKKIVRGGFIPELGCVLGEMDFSGAEILTSILYHKDPTFIEYQTKEGADMHKDACAEILKLKPEEVPKQARQATKGVWTFAQFYGSYYASCALKGWEEFPLLVDKDNKELRIKGTPISKYMIDTFGSYQAFENHLKVFEDKFWNEWFKVYTQWKKDQQSYYVKHGHTLSYFGLRHKGLMSRNEAGNYSIQGSSFHLLLTTIVLISAQLQKKGLKTKLIGQIHDSIVLNIPKDEIEIVAKIIKNTVGTLHEHFDWMTMPMGVDFEISKVREDGGTFAEMHKYDLSNV